MGKARRIGFQSSKDTTKTSLNFVYPGLGKSRRTLTKVGADAFTKFKGRLAETENFSRKKWKYLRSDKVTVTGDVTCSQRKMSNRHNSSQIDETCFEVQLWKQDAGSLVIQSDKDVQARTDGGQVKSYKVSFVGRN